MQSKVETESSESSDSYNSETSVNSQTPGFTFVFHHTGGSDGTPVDFNSFAKIKDFKREVRRRNTDRSKQVADFLTVAEQNAIKLFPRDQVVQSYYIQAQALFPKDELLQYYYAKYWAQETQDKTELFQELEKAGATRAQYDYFLKIINTEFDDIN